jgi:ADP-heptose:LPS heptosyltransferase
VARLSGARECCGLAGPSRQEARSQWLLHRRLPAIDTPHPARVAWQLVRALAPEAPFVLPRLAATSEEQDAEAAALRRIGVDPSRPFGVAVLTDPADARALTAPLLASFAALWQSRGPVVALLGPMEATRPVAVGMPTLRHGRGEPRRLIALGALVARAGGAVLGPDQGATHVLAAAGARCEVAFGAQAPTLTAPPAAIALCHPTPPECSPCRRTRCRHPHGPVCMDFARAEGRVVDVGLPAEPLP